jgi:hypothetical protein
MGGWDKGGGRRAYGRDKGGGGRKEGLHMGWGGTREGRKEEGGLTHGIGRDKGGEEGGRRAYTWDGDKGTEGTEWDKGKAGGKDGELTTNRYPPKEIPEFSRKILTFNLRSCSSVAESNSSFLDASGTSARA